MLSAYHHYLTDALGFDLLLITRRRLLNFYSLNLSNPSTTGLNISSRALQAF